MPIKENILFIGSENILFSDRAGVYDGTVQATSAVSATWLFRRNAYTPIHFVKE
jgi:hypothetical protein